MARYDKKDPFDDDVTLGEIGDAYNQRKYKGVSYSLILKDRTWESSPYPILLAAKDKTPKSILSLFVNKWNSRGKPPRIDLKKHPNDSRDVIVFESPRKKDKSDKTYYKECERGYIRFSPDDAQIMNIPQKSEKDMKLMIDILIMLKKFVQPDKEKKDFFKRLFGL